MKENNKNMKLITEQDLIALGFERVDVTPEESGEGPYYYYIKDILEDDDDCPAITLISDASDVLKNGEWAIEFLHCRAKISNPDLLTKFVDICNEINEQNNK